MLLRRQQHRLRNWPRWTVSFLSLFVSIFVINWLPTILSGAGVTISSAVFASVFLNGGGIVGSLTISALTDRYGYRPMMISYGLGSLALLAIGSLPLAGNAVTFAIFATGVFFIGGQMCLASLSAFHYPRRLRAKGIGWTIGIGRIGGIIGTLTGGILLFHHFSASGIFICAAVVVFTAAAVLATSNRTSRSSRR